MNRELAPAVVLGHGVTYCYSTVPAVLPSPVSHRHCSPVLTAGPCTPGEWLLVAPPGSGGHRIEVRAPEDTGDYSRAEWSVRPVGSHGPRAVFGGLLRDSRAIGGHLLYGGHLAVSPMQFSQ